MRIFNRLKRHLTEQNRTELGMGVLALVRREQITNINNLTNNIEDYLGQKIQLLGLSYE